MRSNITQTVTGHGISFRQSIDDDDPVLQVLELCDALVLTHEIDVLIDLVGEDVHMRMTTEYLRQCRQFLQGIDRATWVAGRGEHEEGRLRRDRRFQFFRGDLIFIFHAGAHQDYLAFAKFHDL